jgi:hypothetical protein
MLFFIAMIDSKLYVFLLADVLLKRLRDPEASIRLNTLKVFLTIAMQRPLSLSHSAVAEIGERVKDKKVEVRCLVLIGFARIYSTHVSSLLPALSQVKRYTLKECLRNIPGDVWEKLNFIPSLIINCFGYPDVRTKFLVLKLIQEDLLPLYDAPIEAECKDVYSFADKYFATDLFDDFSFDSQLEHLDEVRSCALLVLFENLSEDDRCALRSILSHSNRVHSELRQFSLAAAKKQPGEPNKPSLTKERVAKLLQLVPLSEGYSKNFPDQIIALKDQRFLQELQKRLSPEADTSRKLKCKTHMKQRLGASHESLNDYFETAVTISGRAIANTATINQLLAIQLKQSIEADSTALQLLIFLSNCFREVGFLLFRFFIFL